MNRIKLKAEIIRFESLRQFPYDDATGAAPPCIGRLTIGIGWNLSSRGLPIFIIDQLYDIAVNDCIVILTSPPYDVWFNKLSDARQRVIVNMLYNLGPTKFAEFKGLHKALETHKYVNAAAHMLHSLWARQVGYRARLLAKMMQNDTDLET